MAQFFTSTVSTTEATAAAAAATSATRWARAGNIGLDHAAINFLAIHAIGSIFGVTFFFVRDEGEAVHKRTCCE